MKPVLTGQHVLSKQLSVYKFRTLLRRFNAEVEQRGLGLFIYYQYHLYKGIGKKIKMAEYDVSM